MSDSITLFIPCEIYDIRARVAPSENLTPLEQLVLEAIGAGANSLELLTSLFQLGDRPTREIILDLLKQNHITIDPIGSTIRLSAAVAGRDRKGLRELAAAHVEERQFRVMRELVSGHLLSVPYPGACPRPGRALAPASASLTPGRIPPEARDEFLDALSGSVRNELRQSSLRLLSADFPVAHSNQLIPTQRHYLRLRTRVGREPDTGDLVFRIESPVQLPPRIRRDMGRSLAVLAKEAATEPFFRNLEGKVPALEERWEGPGPPLEFLRRTIEGLEGKGIGIVAERHERLVSVRNEVVGLLEEREENRVHAQCVAGTRAILESVRNAILSAQRQLVLVTPTGGTSEPVREAIRQLLAERRVQVFVLWGSRPDEPINGDFASWLSLIGGGARGSGVGSGHRAGAGSAEGGSDETRRVHYAKFSCRTRTPMVIRDATLALLGTQDFFQPRYASGSEGYPEVALLLRSEDGTPSAAIGDILQWTSDAFAPQHGRLLESIRVRGSDWREPDDGPPAEDSNDHERIRTSFRAIAESVPVQPELRERPGEGGEAEVAVRLWRERWREQFSLLARWHGSQEGFATRITDDEHRSLLLRAVRSATSRLVIATGFLIADAADDAFLLALRRRLEGTRLQVVILYGIVGRNAAQPLLRLAEHFFPRLQVLHVPNQAGLLVWDNEVLFSGQGPLSFKTMYGLGGRRQGAVLGVHLNHPAVADALLDGLARQLPDPARKAIESLPRPASADSVVAEDDGFAPPMQSTARSATGLQRLLQQLAIAGGDTRRRSRIIREYFGRLDPTTEGPWVALDQLRSAELGDRDLEMAVCACLTDPAAGTNRAYPGWVCFLAEQAWWKQRFFDAASLLGAVDDHGANAGLPTRRAAELTALRGAQQPFEDRLLELTVNGARDQREAGIAVTVAAIALAEYGWADAADYLSVQRHAWPEAIAPSFEALLQFVEKFGRPFPLGQVHRATALRGAQRARKEAQEAFFAAFDEAEGIHLDFELGKKMLGELFAPDKPFRRLRRAVEAGEVESVRGWIAEYRRDHRGIGRLINDAAGQAAGGVLQAAPIHARRRGGLTRRLEAVVQAARQWADAVVVLPTHDHDLLLKPTLAAGDALAPHAPAFARELEQRRAARDPVAPVMEIWLQLLAPLYQAPAGEAS